MEHTLHSFNSIEYYLWTGLKPAPCTAPLLFGPFYAISCRAATRDCPYGFFVSYVVSWGRIPSVQGDHAGSPLRFCIVFYDVSCGCGHGSVPTISYQHYGLTQPPYTTEARQYLERTHYGPSGPPPPPPPSRFTTYQYSSAGRLRCAAYVKNLRNSGAIAVIESV